MTSHTYRLHLDSPLVRLPDIDDLLGKDVEVTIRELPASETGHAARVAQFLTQSASPAFFGDIEDPVDWQKRIRDDWE